MIYFFDFDGTLVDTLPDIKSCCAEALRKSGIDPDKLSREFPIGPPLPLAIRAVLPDADDKLIGQIVSEFKMLYDCSSYPDTTIFPGIEPLLQRLISRGDKLYIATNKREFPTLKLVDKFNWQAFFAGIICTDSLAGKYSKGELLNYLIERDQLDRSVAVMVGDTVPDIEAGKFAGLKTIAVSWGYDRNEILADANPDAMIDDPAEISGLFGASL